MYIYLNGKETKSKQNPAILMDIFNLPFTCGSRKPGTMRQLPSNVFQLKLTSIQFGFSKLSHIRHPSVRTCTRTVRQLLPQSPPAQDVGSFPYIVAVLSNITQPAYLPTSAVAFCLFCGCVRVSLARFLHVRGYLRNYCRSWIKVSTFSSWINVYQWELPIAHFTVAPSR